MRKTAAVCVAKLYDIDPELVMDQGFIESLQDLLSDSNPMVVANVPLGNPHTRLVSKCNVFALRFRIHPLFQGQSKDITRCWM